MANIDRIVNVLISLKTAGINKKNFSTMLVAGPHVYTLPRVTAYTKADDMLTDGFAATDPLYLAVRDSLSQIPRPRYVKVGRRQVDVVTLQIDSVSNAADYVLKILKKAADSSTTTLTYTYTSDANATKAEIAGGLEDLITADANSPVSAAVSTDDLVLTNKVAGAAFAVQLPKSMSVKSAPATTPVAPAVSTVANDMAAINNEDKNWYGWGLTSRASADIIAAADWNESAGKLFAVSIAEAGAIDAASTTDTGYLLKEGNYFRTAWWYHADAATDFPELATMARCFAVLPGGETWANKRLAGVNTDRLTETQYLAVTGKNGNTFESFEDSVSITQNGKVAAGEWIDVIRFRDWLQTEMQTNVFVTIVNRDKVPYTDGGIATIEAQMKKALDLGQRRGGIAPTEYDSANNEIPGYVTSMPLAASISANTKASRILEDATFSARLAGAIHVANITGSLVYEF